MADTRRITIRIPARHVEALEKLVTEGKFSTVSDAIREAVEQLVEITSTPEYIEKVTVDLPKGDVLGLDTLVKEGDSISIDDAIRNAVKEYVKEKLRRT